MKNIQFSILALLLSIFSLAIPSLAMNDREESKDMAPADQANEQPVKLPRHVVSALDNAWAMNQDSYGGDETKHEDVQVDAIDLENLAARFISATEPIKLKFEGKRQDDSIFWLKAGLMIISSIIPSSLLGYGAQEILLNYWNCEALPKNEANSCVKSALIFSVGCSYVASCTPMVSYVAYQFSKEPKIGQNDIVLGLVKQLERHAEELKNMPIEYRRKIISAPLLSWDLARGVLDPQVLNEAKLIAKLEEIMTVECPICLADLSEVTSPIVRRQCGHFFHRNCLGQWYKKKKICPRCQNPDLSKCEDLGEYLISNEFQGVMQQNGDLKKEQ